MGNLLEAVNRVKRIRDEDYTYNKTSFVTGKVLYGLGDLIEAVGLLPVDKRRAYGLVRAGANKIPWDTLIAMVRDKATSIRVKRMDNFTSVGVVEIDGKEYVVELEDDDSD